MTVNSRPLFIVDCDEVILHQAGPTALWLAEEHGIDCPLSGHGARYRADGASVPPAEIGRLWQLFADTQLHRQTLIEGAREALETFAAIGDVVILTNIPQRYHQARINQLAAHGMHYPVQCNAGLKGRAVAELIKHYGASEVLFIDDYAPHHVDVSKYAPQVCTMFSITDAYVTRSRLQS